ncbi:MAG: hypothetical protein IPP72_01950 [Chitinophagaceae bacterium]|nr:hypothetical protein [Chitinophagaceae bacterium]
MKTLLTTITITASMFLSLNAHCQPMAEPISDAMQAEDISSKTFAITGTSIKPSANGYMIAWEASNQFSVASYELQLSEDNNNFSTVKRRTSGPETTVKYQVQLTNTVILANTVYFRIKVITLDGKVSYTESKRIKIEQI